MTRTRLKCTTFLVSCVFVGIFRLSLAEPNTGPGEGSKLTFPVARGAKSLVPYRLFYLPPLLSNLSDQSISIQLSGNCPICTTQGNSAGHLELSGATEYGSITLRDFKEGRVKFRHEYSAGLDLVVFNLSLVSEISNQPLVIYAQPFEANDTLIPSGSLEYIVRVGGAVVLDPRQLLPPTDFGKVLAYKVQAQPLNGTLEVYTGSRWTPLNLNETFSQVDVNERRIRYRQALPVAKNITAYVVVRLEVYFDQLQGRSVTLSIHFFPISHTSTFKPQINYSISTVQLPEDGTAVINTKNIAVRFSPPVLIFDSEIYAITGRDIEVSVRMIALPHHGTVYLRNSSLSNDSVVSYDDIYAGNLVYVHDGSETTSDEMTVRLTAVSSQLTAPDPSDNILLNFSIVPVNDRPVLNQHRSINPVEGSFVVLNKLFFEVIDPDNDDVDLSISVDPCLNDGCGHFAYVSKDLDMKITEFQMSQVRQNQVVYAFRQLHSSKTLNYSHNVTISDGTHLVHEKLRIAVIPMSISASINSSSSSCPVHVNTLVGGAQTRLSRHSFNITMSQSERLSEVTVNVVRSPALGSLVLDGRVTSEFSFSSLSNVHYVMSNSLSQETYDSFVLRFSIGHGESENLHVPVCITPYPYPIVQNVSSFVLPAKGEVIISSQVLNTTQTGIDDPRSIVYNVTVLPIYGLIMNSDTRQRVNSFTQEDVNSYRIIYKNDEDKLDHHRVNTEFNESFRVAISNRHYQLSRDFRVDVFTRHIVLNVTNMGCSVPENGARVIQMSEFYVEPLNGFSINIYISQHPKHGSLVLKRPDPAFELRDVQYLYVDDLANGYLSYNFTKGNRVEEESDKFIFLIVAANDSDPNDYHKFLGEFNINIEPVNDNPPSRIPITAFSNFHVPVGGTKPFTTKYIEYTDPDGSVDDLLYTVGEKAYSQGGEFCLRGVCPVSSWYQRDMDGSLIYNATNASIGGELWHINVSDGIYHKNDLLVLKIDSIIANRTGKETVRVDEGSTVALTARNLNYITNVQNVSTAEVNYMVTGSPSNGRLLKGNTSVSVFTQADIDANLVFYQQDGSNNLIDSFVFTLQVRQHLSHDNEVHISINPIDDDPPRLTIGRSPLFVSNGSVIYIDNSILSMWDLDVNDTTRLKYHTSGNSAGKMEIQDPKTEQYSNVTNFTQHDVDENLIRYKHNRLTSWRDTVSLQVTDGINQQPTVNQLEIIIVAKDIPLSITPLNILEGEMVTINSSHIDVRHPYFSGQSGRVSIINNVANGVLSFNGSMCVSSCSFGTEVITHGLLTYQHSGSETTQDHFVFKIDWDGTGQSTAETTYGIEVEPVNDRWPQIINNTRLDVYAYQTVTLSPSHLSTLDLDTPSQLIWYRFSISPDQKREVHFVLNGTQSDVFTQADINDGRVLLVDQHRYDDKLNLSFTVSDGDFNVSGKLLVRTVEVELQMLSHETIIVPMGQSVPVNSSILAAATNTNDLPHSSIVFLVDTSSGQKYGRLVDLDYPESTSINQSRISSGRVVYRHTAVDQWEQLDTVNLIVHHPFALENLSITVQVQIQLLETPNSELAIKRRLSIREKGRLCLDQSLIDARNIRYYTWKRFRNEVDLLDLSIEFSVPTQPVRGNLSLFDTPNTPITSFTQSQLVSRQVCYRNDGSENKFDSFWLKVTIKNSTSGAVINDTVPSEEVEIDIQLYNDEKPYLVSSLPLRKTFVQDFNGFITSSDILVQDTDTDPQDITYTVVTEPNIGRLVLGADSTVSIHSFKQYDINSNRLLYVPTEVGNDSFTFSFTDGYHSSSINYTFEIQVNKLYLNLPSYHELKIVQSRNYAHINASILNATTNGIRAETRYTVVSAPQWGEVLLSNRVSRNFTQQDVDTNLVTYRPSSSLSRHSDRMNLTVSNSQETFNFTLLVTIVADGRVNNSIVLGPRSPQVIPSNLLDLSSIQSAKSPRIKITSELSYGFLSLKYGDSDDSIGPSITEFRYYDLESGRLCYTWRPKVTPVSSGEHVENIRGLVHVDGMFPPGEFQVKLTVIAPPIITPSMTSSTVAIPSSDPPTTTGGSNQSSRQDFQASFYVPLLGLFVVVVMLLIVVIVFCCYHSKVIKSNLAKTFTPPLTPIQKPPGGNPYSSPLPPLAPGPAPQDYSDTDSSTSGADIMMVQNMHHESHPMMTISASHTHIPFLSQDYGYHTHTTTHSSRILSDDCYSPTSAVPQHRHVESPHAAVHYTPTGSRMGGVVDSFVRGSDIRSTSPVRRASPIRRNTRRYSSLSRVVNAGRSSPVKSLRDYPTQYDYTRPESSSSLGYDSSCLTEESIRHSRPPSVITPPAVSRIDTTVGSNKDSNSRSVYASVRPVLKAPQYWV